MAMWPEKSNWPSARPAGRRRHHTDLAGDGDHYAAMVVSGAFKARPGSSSTRWFTTHFRGAWAGNCTPFPCRHR